MICQQKHFEWNRCRSPSGTLTIISLSRQHHFVAEILLLISGGRLAQYRESDAGVLRELTGREPLIEYCMKPISVPDPGLQLTMLDLANKMYEISYTDVHGCAPACG
jgi:hypothetical protein